MIICIVRRLSGDGRQENSTNDENTARHLWLPSPDLNWSSGLSPNTPLVCVRYLRVPPFLHRCGCYMGRKARRYSARSTDVSTIRPKRRVWRRQST